MNNSFDPSPNSIPSMPAPQNHVEKPRGALLRTKHGDCLSNPSAVAP